MNQMNMPYERSTQPQALGLGQPMEQTSESAEINLLDLWYNLLDFKWVAAAIVAVATAIGLLYATVATPIYSADVLLQVETKQTGGLAALEDVSGVLAAGGSNVTGELEIIKSRTVVESVAQTLGLAQSITPQYFPVFGQWLANQHEAALGLAQPFMGLNEYAWGGEQLKLAQFSVPTEFTDQPFVVVKGEGNTFSLYSPFEELLGQGTVGQPFTFKIGYGSGSITISQFEANPGMKANVVRRHPLSLHNGLVGPLSAGEVGRNSSMIRVSYESPNPAFAVQFLNELANAYLRQNVERKGQEAEQQLVFLDEQLPSIKEQLRKAEDALNVFVQSKGTIDPTLDTQRILGQDVEQSLDLWVLEKAISQLKAWQKKGSAYQISVNITAKSIQSSVLFDKIIQLFEKCEGIEPSLLQIEILETSVIGINKTIQENIERILALGVTIALDDFGTGHSTLTHLKNLNVNMFKIDKSFVMDMLSDSGDYVIVKGVIGLANAFNIQVIAEGVENQLVAEELVNLGCSYIQGYWVSKPLPIDEINELIRHWDNAKFRVNVCPYC